MTNSDHAMETNRLRDALLEHIAGVMLVAARETCGVALTADEFNSLRERIIDAIRGRITL